MKNYHNTILIVEDDPNDQRLIQMAFRANGVTGTLRVVSDGVEAIDYLKGEGQYADREKFPYPTFIMTDLKMPRADGFNVLEHLKGNPEWSIIPTVVFTASSDLDDIKKSYMLGASSYHIKPGSYPQLRHQLKILHDYWMTCEVPQIDSTGKRVITESKGKLGERYPQTP